MLRFTMLLIAIGILPLSLRATELDAENLLYLYNAEGELQILDNEKAKLYIERFVHIAISEMDRSGIPASIKMAQGILESGSGMSSLAQFAHNHFGIKCGGSWTGKTYYLWDDDVAKSCFRVFDKDEDSYIAHTDFISNPSKSSRYGFLFELETTDYKGWANGLQKAGYATSQTYARSLISIIERYQLYKLDHLTFKSQDVAAGELDSIFNLTQILPVPLDTMVDEPHFVMIPDPFGNIKDTIKMTLTKTSFTENGLITVFVQPDEDLKAIAKRLKISEKKLIKYNEIPKGYKLKAGQYIYLEEKKKSYSGKDIYHIVREGQEMYDIAQHFGLKKHELLKLNKVYKNNKPQAGTKIRLINLNEAELSSKKCQFCQ